MKIGQKVRVKASGKIGVIADSEFFYWNRRRHVRYEVKFENQKDTVWYPKEDLSTDMVEKLKITFSGENGTLYLDLCLNHDKYDGIHTEISGDPENLKNHNGLHVWAACELLKKISSNS